MSQSPKPPNPFDPVEEEQISRMVNEGGRDFLPDTVREALEIFAWLNKGGTAPSVIVVTDGSHSSARWVNPRKKP